MSVLTLQLDHAAEGVMGRGADFGPSRMEVFSFFFFFVLDFFFSVFI
jgi:hypothetical protein